MTFSAEVFKSYDIRGISGETITEEFAYHLGRHFAHHTKASEIAVGYDARLTSKSLSGALIKGITDQGAEAIDIGMVSSDMLYFSTGKYQYGAGIMVTASHNPAEYNGFKACITNAVPFVFDDIKDQVLSGDLPPLAAEKGQVIEEDILADWIDFITSFVSVEHIPAMKVVVDAGNGCAGHIVSALFEKIPQCELIPLYFEPDGRFPNHPAYPIVPENLVDLEGRMEQEGAKLGVAFDGDADRVVLVDDKYNMVSGTIMSALIVDHMLKHHHQNETFIYNALVGSVVPDLLAKYGAKGIRSKVGHTNIKKLMNEHGAYFGCEHSAHYFFKDFWNADSGIIAMLYVMAMLGEKDQPLSEVRKQYETYAESGELNFTVEDRNAKIAEITDAYADLRQDELDGVTIYGDGWKANVRPSGTEPLLRLNIESQSDDIVRQKVQEFSKIIER